MGFSVVPIIWLVDGLADGYRNAIVLVDLLRIVTGSAYGLAIYQRIDQRISPGLVLDWPKIDNGLEDLSRIGIRLVNRHWRPG